MNSRAVQGALAAALIACLAAAGPATADSFLLPEFTISGDLPHLSSVSFVLSGGVVPSETSLAGGNFILRGGPRAIPALPPPPTGACCLPDGTCSETTAFECAGGWIGGVGCDPSPCLPVGSCCYSHGACESTTEALCSGIWTMGGACDPNPCPVGACCHAGGSCTMLSADGCAGVGGAFQGAGAACDPNPCPQWCAGDADCDGAVTFFDIDPFVAKLGCPSSNPNCNIGCPWANSDVNGDGRVDFFDIDPFVARLGESCP